MADANEYAVSKRQRVDRLNADRCLSITPGDTVGGYGAERVALTAGQKDTPGRDNGVKAGGLGAVGGNDPIDAVSRS